MATSNGHISAMHYPIHGMYVRKPYFALGLLIYTVSGKKEATVF